MIQRVIGWLSIRLHWGDRNDPRPWMRLAGPYFTQSIGLLSFSGLCMLVVLASAILAVWSDNRRPLPTYHVVQPVTATTPDSGGSTTRSARTTQIRVLDSPSASIQKVERWSVRALRSTFNLSFRDVHTRIEGARHYFTPSGWRSFQSAIDGIGLANRIIDNQMQLVVVPLRDARVTHTMTYGDIRLWRVSIPMLFSYTGANRPEIKLFTVHLLIHELPTTQSVEGVGIASIRLGKYNQP